MGALARNGSQVVSRRADGAAVNVCPQPNSLQIRSYVGDRSPASISLYCRTHVEAPRRLLGQPPRFRSCFPIMLEHPGNVATLGA